MEAFSSYPILSYQEIPLELCLKLWTLNISPRDDDKLTVCQQNSLTVELVEHTVGASWLFTRHPSIVML